MPDKMRGGSVRRIFPVVLALAVAACGKPHPQQSGASDQAAASLPLNDDNFQKLNDRVAKLENDAQIQKFLNSADEMTYLTPEDKGWSSIKTVVGTLAVSLANVKDYANGSEVVLKFGNPTAAKLSDISMDVEWGKNNAQGYPDGDPLTKEVKLVDDLPAGSWHSVSVDLRDVPSKDLGYIHIKNFKVESISLRK